MLYDLPLQASPVSSLIPASFNLATAVADMQAIMGNGLIMGVLIALAAAYVAEHAAMAVLRVLHKAMTVGSTHDAGSHDSGVE